jgi:4-amino-4-deoxy-L-arabinose transferase-like glycosyltransferase
MPGASETAIDPQRTRAGISPRQAALLALLTIAGAWLRLSHLGTKSLWIDEGATVALSRASWQHFAWVWWHGEANLQTIYFLLLRGWIHLGNSETWLRFPSALFGIAAIPLLYFVARKFMGVEPALAAAALLAFSPTHVYYSQEARGYTLAILMVLLSTYFFVRAVESCRRRDWALWMWTSILAFYCHDFTALVLVAQACSMLFKAEPKRWRSLLIRGTIIFALAVPGLTYVFRASPENLHFIWMPRPSAKGLWHLAGFFGGNGVKLVVAGILWISGLVAIWHSRRSAHDRDAFWRGMLILLWALLPVLMLALISEWQPLFLQRYVIFSLPAMMLLAALGTECLRKWNIGLWLVVLLCGMSIPTVLGDYRKPREDWRSASNSILAAAAPGDAVVFFPFYSRIMLDYYRDKSGTSTPLHIFAPQYYAGGEDARNLLNALDSEPTQFRHVFVVVAIERSTINDFDYGSAVTEKLQSIYGEPAVHKFADVELLEFERQGAQSSVQ